MFNQIKKMVATAICIVLAAVFFSGFDFVYDYFKKPAPLEPAQNPSIKPIEVGVPQYYRCIERDEYGELKRPGGLFERWQNIGGDYYDLAELPEKFELINK